jgi:hypothetical protein
MNNEFLSDTEPEIGFPLGERPGLWYPHGEGHRVFRKTIECEGCGLVECLERGNECINRITTDEVLSACHDILAKQSLKSAQLSAGVELVSNH